MVVYVPGSTAVVLDSPHSGVTYPPDFGHCCELALLRTAEDTHVEKLYDFAPALGVACRFYMDEKTLEPTAGFGALRGHRASLVQMLLETDPRSLA